MSRNLAWSLSNAFMPPHRRCRLGLHSYATFIGVSGAYVMTAGRSLAAGVGWYAIFFFIAHVALVPILLAWISAVDAATRWVRGIVEEELTYYDLRTYSKQLQRVFPNSSPNREREDS